MQILISDKHLSRKWFVNSPLSHLANTAFGLTNDPAWPHKPQSSTDCSLRRRGKVDRYRLCWLWHKRKLLFALSNILECIPLFLLRSYTMAVKVHSDCCYVILTGNRLSLSHSLTSCFENFNDPQAELFSTTNKLPVISTANKLCCITAAASLPRKQSETRLKLCHKEGTDWS